jgi:hypothetical protein
MALDEAPQLEDGDTVRSPLDEVLAEELRSIRSDLEALPDSPRARELRGWVSRYERDLSSCRLHGGDSARLGALCELVCELQGHAEALARAPAGTSVSTRPAP